jgi:Rad3-related DNA helicase
MQIESEDCIFIFDEAHNLPNRIRAILSTTINKKIIELAIKELQRVDKKKINPGIKEFMDEFQDNILN